MATGLTAKTVALPAAAGRGSAIVGELARGVGVHGAGTGARGYGRRR